MNPTTEAPTATIWECKWDGKYAIVISKANSKPTLSSHGRIRQLGFHGLKFQETNARIGLVNPKENDLAIDQLLAGEGLNPEAKIAEIIEHLGRHPECFEKYQTRDGKTWPRLSKPPHKPLATSEREVCITIMAAAWFRRPDFQTFLNLPRLAASLKPGGPPDEFTEVYMTFHGVELDGTWVGSDAERLPVEIFAEIWRVLEASEVESGILRIINSD